MFVDIINIALDYWLKPTVVIALLMSLVQVVYRFNASSSHWLLYSGLCSFLVCSLVAIFLPTISISFLPASMQALTQYPLFNGSEGIAIFLIVSAGYLLGFLWIVIFQLMGLWDIAGLSRRAVAIEPNARSEIFESLGQVFPQKLDIKISNEIASPVVWGFKSPVILLPSSYQTWKKGRLIRVLTHEIAHIERNDWLSKVLLKITCTIFWVVPMVWVLARKIEWFAELSCDDSVVRRFNCRTDYAQDLLDISRGSQSGSWALSFVKKSDTFTRIQYVLDGRNQREAISPYGKLSNFCLCMFLVFPIALFQLGVSDITSRPHAKLVDVSLEGGAVKYYLTEDEPDYLSPSQLKNLLAIKSTNERPVEEVLVSYSQEVEETQSLSGGFHGVSVDERPNRLMDNARIRQPLIAVKGVVPQYMHTPRYPKRAIRRNIEGNVLTIFDIDEAGNVVNPRIVESTPSKIFNKEVIKALKKSKFTPMELNGRPIKIKNIQETFVFQLKESTADR